MVFVRDDIDDDDDDDQLIKIEPGLCLRHYTLFLSL